MTIIDQLKEVRSSGDGWTAKCPGHDDTHSSLSVNHRDGKWLLKCHAGCSIEQITSAMGIRTSDLFDADTRRQKANGKARFVAEYIYRTANGEPNRKVCRTADKGFPQFNWNGSKWESGTKGTPILPYRLHELVKTDSETPVFICEGEKDCDRLAALGFIATTNPMGAGKWRAALNKWFAHRSVTIVPDADDPGRKHADDVARHLKPIATRIRVVELPGLTKKGADVSDWLDLGHTKEELLALVDAAPDYAAPAAPEAAPANDATPSVNGDEAELERLARLPLLDYERGRKAAGDRLGVKRLSLLDALVKVKRAELGLDADDGKQGHAISFPEAEPWPDSVNGGELLDAVAKAIRRHVVMPDHACDAVALWCAHTFLLDRLMISPRLGIRSPTKGCGKTTLLDVVAQLVLKPLSAANISASAVFRVVEAVQPVLLVDEADSFLSEQEELRGILNSGHRRGGSVLRVTGEDLEPRSFSTYGACAIALIGSLPATLTDRSVLIDLARRKADEAIEPFRFDRVEHLVELRRKLARWMTDNAEAVAATEPQMPALYNRAADNWRGLLAIATVAGADWLARGHRAALAGADTDIDEGSRLELLLGDVRDIFARLGVDRIPSAELIEELVKIEPRPWGEYGKSGKPITQNKLARLLKPVGISSGKIGPSSARLNGYEHEWFKEAFGRYLGPVGGFQPDIRTQCDEQETSDTFKADTPENECPLWNCEKSNNDGVMSGCPVSGGGLGNGDEETEAFPLVCEHCGAPEQPDDACLEVAADGGIHRIHTGCVNDWMGVTDTAIPPFLRQSQ